MILTANFIEQFSTVFRNQKDWQPWDLTKHLSSILYDLIANLDDQYEIKTGIAIHKTAVIESGAVIKDAVIIGANAFVGANAYLRGGVYLGNSSRIGPGCEVKTSVIFNNSAIAHFNFIGDSVIGNHVNFEGGSVTANHYNERSDKRIFVLYQNNVIDTKSEKFGALVGDKCKIGANAVLSPGTILEVGSIVRRLELVEQVPAKPFSL